MSKPFVFQHFLPLFFVSQAHLVMHVRAQNESPPQAKAV